MNCDFLMRMVRCLTALRKHRVEFQVPKPEELIKAHETFENKEPRHRDYWRAVEGVEDGLRAGNLGDVANSVAAFLKSWNRDYYRYKPGKLSVLQPDLQQLITQHLQAISAFRARSLSTLTEADRPTALSLFASFEQKLGPVGTAKALSALAPNFFPLWDNPISYQYGVVCAAHGYFLFMVVVKYQVGKIKLPDNLAPLKTLDEYNYCRYTKNWLP